MYTIEFILSGKPLENELNFKLHFDSRENLLKHKPSISRLIEPMLRQLEEYQVEHPMASEVDLAEANETMKDWGNDKSSEK